MASTRQEKEFTEAVIPDLLDQAVAWIGSNMNPDDVFSESDLQHWAANNGYTEEQYE